jgi:HEAT repeat protein
MDLPDIFRPNVARLRERKDREGLVKALEYQKDAAVRREAVKALGELADPSLLDPLARALVSEASWAVDGRAGGWTLLRAPAP